MKWSFPLSVQPIVQQASEVFNTIPWQAIGHSVSEQVRAWTQPLVNWVQEEEVPFYIKTQSDKGFRQQQAWRSAFKHQLRVLQKQILQAYRQGASLSGDKLYQTLLEQQADFKSTTVSVLFYDRSLRRLAQRFPQYAHAFEGACHQFKETFKAHPQKALRYFYQDLSHYLILVSGQKINLEQLRQALSYYREYVPSQLYQAVLALLQNFQPTAKDYPLYYPYRWVSSADMERLFRQFEQVFLSSESLNPKIIHAMPSYFVPSKQEAMLGSSSTLAPVLNYVKKHPKMGFALGAIAGAAIYQSKTSLYEVQLNTLGFAPINQVLSTLPLMQAWPIMTQVMVSYGYGRGPVLDMPIASTSLTMLSILISLFPASKGALQTRRLDNEFQVNNYTLNNQQNPTIAAFPNGNFVITWESFNQDGNNWGVYGQLFDATGTKLGDEFRINNQTNSYQGHPTVASVASNNFMVGYVAYGQDGSSDYGILAQLFNNTGAKIGSEFTVNNYTLGDQQDVIVAALSANTLAMVWDSVSQNTTLGRDIYGQLFTASSAKIGSEFIVNNYTLGDQSNPAVTGLSNGNFVVTWRSVGQVVLNTPSVFVQLFNSSGNTIGTPFQVDAEHSTTYQRIASVASFCNDNFVVAWIGRDASLDGVSAQIFNASGQNVTNAFQVNTYTLGYQTIQVTANNYITAALSNSRFAIVWQSDGQDGSGYGVYAQIFNAMGGKIGREFQVNDYTPGDQIQPAIRRLTDENLLITWTSQDGSDNGVYGKIIDTHLYGTNLNQTNSYTEDAPYTFNPITIVPPIFIDTITATLKLWDAAVGFLSTSTQGNTTSTYNNQTGIWQATGNTTEVNALLANQQYIPARDFNGNVTIEVSLNDGFNVPLNGTLVLTGNPVNDMPELLNNQLTVQQGEKVILNSNNLNATDVDSLTSSLQFIVSDIFYGYFERSMAQGIPISNFSQQEIWDGTIHFNQDNSTNAPTYRISVSDGLLNTTAQAANITFIPRSLTTSPLTTASLTTQELTTSPLTTDGLTTDPITASPLTTSQPTQTTGTNEVTSGVAAITTNSVTTGDANFASSSNSPNNTPLIIGATIGGAALLGLAGVTGFILYRRNLRPKPTNDRISNVNDYPLVDITPQPSSPNSSNTPKTTYEESIFVERTKEKEEESQIISSPDTIKVVEASGSHSNAKNYPDIPAQSSARKPTAAQRIIILKNGMKVRLLNHRELGKGAGGKVVLGQIVDTNKLIAVKKIKGKEEDLQKEMEKLNEFSSAKRDSNKIAPTYGELLISGRKQQQETQEKKLYIFARLLKSGSGEELKKTLNAMSSLKEKCKKLSLLAQDLLEGLQSLHRHDLYHLDVKPANFMLNEQDERIDEGIVIRREMAVLIDFDCAQKSDDGRIYTGRGDSKYYSPQRWDVFRHLYIKYRQGVMDNGISITVPSSYKKEYYRGAAEDAWALGVTLLELLMGKNPFAEGVTDQYPGIKSIAEGVNKGTPEWFQDMLNQLEETNKWFKKPKNPIVTIIKGLLAVDIKNRLTIDEALQTLQEKIILSDNNNNQSPPNANQFKSSSTALAPHSAFFSSNKEEKSTDYKIIDLKQEDIIRVPSTESEQTQRTNINTLH